MESEMVSMSGIALIIAILEHLGPNDPQIIGYIDSINTMYLQEMGQAQTSDYKNMLIQGVMTNMWYDQ